MAEALVSSATLPWEECFRYSQIRTGFSSRRCLFKPMHLSPSTKKVQCSVSCKAIDEAAYFSPTNTGHGYKTRRKGPFAAVNTGRLEKFDFDVVIVGAGIIGLTIARQFLLNTNLSVGIVDAKRPCAGATGAGQGYIWLGYRTPESDKWELEARSKQLWDKFVGEVEASGLDPLKALGWKKTGSLLVGATSKESVMLQERAKLLSKAGIRAEFIPASNLHQVEPALEIGKEGGAAFIPDDSQIDARLSVSFIEENNKAFVSQGRYEEFFEDPVVNFIRSKRAGHVEGVQTSSHVLYGNKAVIVAAGAWSCSLIGKLAKELNFPLHVPVKPRKGHLLVLERHQPFHLNHGLMEIGYSDHQIASSLQDDSSVDNSFSSLDTLSVSMTATTDSHGNLVLGSSRQFAGFDCQMEKAVVISILERAAKFLPALSNISPLQLTQDGHIRIGLRPYMADGKPVIGPVPNLPKLMLATGHEGAGLCMALGTAEMVVDMVLGNSMKVDPRPFSPVGRCCK
ncbi:hypothetical protein SUGI_0447790 [Cryptomeria japonica]|uniref:uncharacterized protein LOC131033442 isoform X2 n=1 Tax=Cryptomeria japonica TaxID=3369 RepID=UPI002408B7AD|nr:uncharacterized protein LOC131033442 isoform X2 [Cryptomeria japonica]GLJ23642.1 hypothetical protein SUGI_0447790 [Cryptomeria japonica]